MALMLNLEASGIYSTVACPVGNSMFVWGVLRSRYRIARCSAPVAR
jgi:hypothetical protein